MNQTEQKTRETETKTEEYLTKSYIVITVFDSSDTQCLMFITKSRIRAKNYVFDALYWKYGVDSKGSNSVRMDEYNFESEFQRDHPGYPLDEEITL